MEDFGKTILLQMDLYGPFFMWPLNIFKLHDLNFREVEIQRVP